MVAEDCVNSILIYQLLQAFYTSLRPFYIQNDYYRKQLKLDYTEILVDIVDM
jgi:hypothetical protein